MLSIIIPAFNREGLIAETLESVRSQTRGDWECLVVDDHSTDGTEAVIRKFCRSDSRFKFLRRPESLPKGPSACRNFGFTQASGEYIYFLDSDDLLTSDFAESYIPLLEKKPELDFLSFRFVRFDKTTNHIVRVAKPKPTGISILETIASCQTTVGTQCFLWRKSFLDLVPSLWLEDLSYGEDREFAFRIIHYARKGLWVNEPVCVFYRRNRSGLCYKRRYNRQILTDTLRSYKSSVDICKRFQDKSVIQDHLASIFPKQMRLALKFGDRNVLQQLYELSEQLEASPQTRRRIRKLGAHPLLGICCHRPMFLFSGFFVRLFFGH